MSHIETDPARASTPRADWRDDRWLWIAAAVALTLRVLPMVLWAVGDCVRDECIYRARANDILDGHGLTTTEKGWLPAPGYPYLLALMKLVFGAMFAVKHLQIILSLATLVVMYRIAERIGGRKVARTAAMLMAIHPTLAFMTGTMWIEPVYVFFLLNAILAMLWAREGAWRRGMLSGAMIGGAVLFRGVATYLPPIFLLAAVWPEAGWTGLRPFVDEVRARWKHGAAFLVAMVLVVSPWSLYASQRYGGPMVSDATAGHVLYLGNNDYPPLTFDYGNGMLTGPLYARYLRLGRRPCDRGQLPVVSNACEVRHTMEWIGAHPDVFVQRVPMRLAQMFNPNSFLTRHIRWGYWGGLPFLVKEAIAVWVVLTSFLVLVGGTIGAFARARGPYGVMAVGTVIYTCATIAVAYGMTRFRIPLEAVWIPYLAVVLAEPRETLARLRVGGPRAAGLLLTVPALLALMTWYLPTGFPWFW